MGKVALAVAGLAATAIAATVQATPSSYSECILEHMRGIGSDMAARAIAQACADRFPAKKEAQAPAKKEPAAADAQPPAVDPTGQWTDFKPGPPK